ncbi:LysR family transcriptional regulator [Algimonas porphyrae]|uniref:LysR family transcriptional regulator n=1 Tax=Algimonas porphyrae TaxID=1128113 RepID=A0ABQ5UXU6_9PROT|nr:LysR family transcriptional regulator [Algimonas porphyrae]GLQ19532.1 LysR family transcriptional regulator [Algimonas porphyrae]
MPDSIDWDKLKTFHAAARTGSLTGAAEDLGISQSAVSRQIAALEDRMNMPLFHRHARGLTLTEEGQVLFKTADEVHGKIAMSLATVQNVRQLPQGVLRVSSPISLGSNWLTTVLPEFIKTYPDIEVQLLLEDSEHDLMSFDVDCALRPWPSTQGDLIERKLGQITQSLYASPAYLSEYGAPASAQDLDDHAIVAFGDLLPSKLQSSNWALTAGRDEGAEPRKPVMSINNLHGIMRAAESGVGVAGLPDYMTAATRRLVRILPDVRGESFELYFVYPTELRGSAKAKVFREFLQRATRTSPSFIS